MPAHACYLERDLALMHLLVTGLAKGEQVGERILTALPPIDEVMGLQAALLLATVLAAVAIPQQTGDAQVLIQPRRVLVLAPAQRWIVEASNIHLNILYDSR